MSDAQAEAERIVARHEVLVARQPHDGSEAKSASGDRLADALAAAIEVAERVDMSPTRRGHMPDKASTRQLLAAQVDTLSALRQTDGEDT